MGRMSNRDRIFRAAEEARLAAEEKSAKRAAKESVAKSPRRASKTSAQEGRMKLVWAIFNSSGRAVQTFAYGDKASAETELQRRSGTAGEPYELRATKVPMGS